MALTRSHAIRSLHRRLKVMATSQHLSPEVRQYLTSQVERLGRRLPQQLDEGSAPVTLDELRRRVGSRLKRQSPTT